MSVLTITSENFEQEVLNASEPVLVDFWATWCGPCKMFSPIVDKVAEEMEGKVKFGKVNVDEQPDLAQKYNVMSIPTAILFKNGEKAAVNVGLMSNVQLKEFVSK